MLFRAVLVVLMLAAALPAPADAWYKGTTHAHSFWSDGNAPPEVIAKWYKEKGYHFICLSEHHVLQEGERFVSVIENSRFGPKELAALRAEFGEEWPSLVAGENGRPRMRLKTHEELSAYFNEPGRFLLIPGEEITTIMQPPHVNGINLREPIRAERRGDKAAIVEKYLQAVADQARRYGIATLAHLNHINFEGGLSAEDLLRIPSLRYFEVFNAQRGVKSWGIPDTGHPPHERTWDVVLALRMRQDPGFALYGVATDDCHVYDQWGPEHNNPGRGWVMVRAPELNAEAIIRAMDRGDFYASSGVTLKALESDGRTLRIEIDPMPGAAYRTRYIGTRKDFDDTATEFRDAKGEIPDGASRVYGPSIGQVLLESESLASSYTFAGDELYVRVEVASSLDMENPTRPGMKARAWTQPLPPGKVLP